MAGKALPYTKVCLLAKKYDKVAPGYIPIQILPDEYNSLIQFYKYPQGVKDTTIGDALKVLNFPHRLLDRPYSPVNNIDVNKCSKLGFLIKTLTDIKNKDCNLDIAIVASTRQTETLLVNVLNLYGFQYKPLSQCFDNQPPVLGALVRFRKIKSADRAPNFKLSVDYIIVYDAACMIDRNYVSHFKGVYYAKPKVVSLVCDRTADLRICNFRDKQAHKVMNGETSLEEPGLEVMTMFCTVVYPKLKVVERLKANDNLSQELVAWMLGKEDRTFFPSRPSYQPPLPPTVGNAGKRRASEMTGAAPPNPPSKRAMPYKGPNYHDHIVPPPRLALLRARIQTSFPLKGLNLSSLILHDGLLKGVDWLSGTTLINTRKHNISRSEVGSTSRSGNVAPISHTPSAESSTSTYRPSPVAPSIHPSRLAMIEASHQPSSYQSSSTPHTQPQKPNPPVISTPGQPHSEPDTLVQTNDNSMQNGLEESADTQVTPRDGSQESTEDYISLNNTANTTDDSPKQMDRQDTEEASDKSTEEPPQLESDNGFNEFEVALERAHLELMRSLLGKGDDE